MLFCKSLICKKVINIKHAFIFVITYLNLDVVLFLIRQNNKNNQHTWNLKSEKCFNFLCFLLKALMLD